MAIRYDKKLNNEIRKIVNNYNAKVKRLEQKDDPDIFVPKRVNADALKSLKASVGTRKELKRRLQDLQEFTTRGGEQMVSVKGGYTIPKFQLKSIKKYRSLISRRLTEREKFNKTTRPTYEGKRQQFTIAEQFNEEQQNIVALRESLLDVDYTTKSPRELQAYLERLQANARTVNLSTWQKNYADMLLDTAYVYNIPHAKIIELRQKLLNLSPKQFDKLFKTESTIKQIIYYYNQVNELGVDIAFENMEGDVTSVYNSLFENIDEILKDYQ